MPTLQAFILYEEAIPDSKAEIMALQSIAGVLHRCHVFGRENRDILVHKATGYSAKLLKKADQCRAVCTCSHLYWQDEVGLPTCLCGFPRLRGMHLLAPLLAGWVCLLSQTVCLCAACICLYLLKHNDGGLF